MKLVVTLNNIEWYLNVPFSAYDNLIFELIGNFVMNCFLFMKLRWVTSIKSVKRSLRCLIKWGFCRGSLDNVQSLRLLWRFIPFFSPFFYDYFLGQFWAFEAVPDAHALNLGNYSIETPLHQPSYCCSSNSRRNYATQVRQVLHLDTIMLKEKCHCILYIELFYDAINFASFKTRGGNWHCFGSTQRYNIKRNSALPQLNVVFCVIY